MVEMAAQQVMRLGITVVLTRLIAPSEFGLLAMALVFTQLAVMVGDLGLGPALQQRTTVERRHVATATFITAVTGVAFAAAIALLAPVIADFYNEPRLEDVVEALSVVFILRSVGTIPRDLLRRNLRFKALALSSTTAISVSGVVAIVAALQGAGIAALVIQVLVENVLAALLYCGVALRSRVWKPAIGFNGQALRDLAAFGASVSGTRLSYYGATNIDNLIIGRVLGAAPLGLYNLAYRLMLFPVIKVADVIAVVSMPALASIKDQPARVAEAYKRTVVLVSAVCFPVSVGTAVLASALVPAIFGDRWLAAIPVVQVLAINGVRLALSRMSNVIYEAMGRPHIDFLLTTVTFAIYTVATLIGVQYGIVGVAWGLTIAGHLIIPIDLYLLRRTIPISLVGLASRLFPVVLATTALGLVGWLINYAVDLGPVAVSVLGVLACTAVYFGTLVLAGPSLMGDIKRTVLRR